MSESDAVKADLAVIKADLADLKGNEREIKQAIFGPRGIPNGIVGEIRQLKEEVKEWRRESKEENNDVRRAIRNLVFAILVSGAGVVVAQIMTQ